MGQQSDIALERIGRLAARDAFPKDLGIECVEAGLGRAVVRIVVAERHLNCNGSCHGGLIFTLGDTAFGLASNSYGMTAASIDVHIVYHVAARPGDVLTATATEVSRNRKLGVYRIAITREDAGATVLIASFTGTAFITERPND